MEIEQIIIEQSSLLIGGIAMGSILLIIIAIIISSMLISYAVSAILLSRVFKKAGVEEWKAWIPVYNTWTLLEIGDQKGYWAIILFIPAVDIIAYIFLYVAMYNIGLKLGKKRSFVLLAIFLQIIWLLILAADSSKWNEKAKGLAKSDV